MNITNPTSAYSFDYYQLCERELARQESLYPTIRAEDVEAEAERVIKNLKGSNWNHFPSITWSMPSVATIDSIKRHMTVKGMSKILDVGCGRGYISWRLRQVGIEPLPIDHTPSLGSNWKLLGEPFVERFDFDTEDQILDMVRRNARNSALLLSWPPCSNPMGANTLKAFKEGGGKLCFVLGEPEGGCVGSEEMWEILRKEWSRENSFDDGSDPLPVRSGIWDSFFVYYVEEPWLESNNEDGSSLERLFWPCS